MKNTGISLIRFIRSGFTLALIFAATFINPVYAQPMLAINLINGMNEQIPVNGLKLTFDNNGSFSCWQNGSRLDISFDSVDVIYFTGLPIGIDEIISNGMNDISCYPNPFNDEVSIELFTDGPAKTSIDVFNGNGQLIEHIIPATSLSHGNHLFKWNGRNGNGQKVDRKSVV